jgi:hypothetical protein
MASNVKPASLTITETDEVDTPLATYRYSETVAAATGRDKQTVLKGRVDVLVSSNSGSFCSSAAISLLSSLSFDKYLLIMNKIIISWDMLQGGTHGWISFISLPIHIYPLTQMASAPHMNISSCISLLTKDEMETIKCSIGITS